MNNDLRMFVRDISYLKKAKFQVYPTFSKLHNSIYLGLISMNGQKIKVLKNIRILLLIFLVAIKAQLRGFLKL